MDIIPIFLGITFIFIFIMCYQHKKNKTLKPFCDFIVANTPIEYCYLDMNVGHDNVRLVYQIGYKIKELTFPPHWNAKNLSIEINSKVFN
jgi:hypothetical protein